MTQPRWRKSRLARDVESQQKRGPLENWLPDLVEELGFADAATQLGVSKGSVQNWIGKMGYRCEQERRLVPASGGEENAGSGR